MKDGIYSVLDTVAGVYLPPFTFQNDNLAKRMFKNCANDPIHIFAKNPVDFQLVKIGEFDNSTGEVLSFADGNLKLGFAQDYLEGEQ